VSFEKGIKQGQLVWRKHFLVGNESFQWSRMKEVTSWKKIIFRNVFDIAQNRKSKTKPFPKYKPRIKKKEPGPNLNISHILFISNHIYHILSNCVIFYLLSFFYHPTMNRNKLVLILIVYCLLFVMLAANAIHKHGCFKRS
jgi:hypothetical protein